MGRKIDWDRVREVNKLRRDKAEGEVGLIRSGGHLLRGGYGV